MTVELTLAHVGWYTSASQPSDRPTRAPTDKNCPICGKPWTDDDVRAHSLAPVERSFSVFYYTHRTCVLAHPAVVRELDKQALQLGKASLS